MPEVAADVFAQGHTEAGPVVHGVHVQRGAALIHLDAAEAERHGAGRRAAGSRAEQ